MSYQQRAVYVMQSFLQDFSSAELSAFAAAAYGNGKFSHPDVAPVRPVDGNTWCLELWHGLPAPSRIWRFRCCPICSPPP